MRILRIPIVQLLLAVTLLMIAWCGACKPGDNNRIYGRYINQGILSGIQDSVAGINQEYCYELNFINADSVDVSYSSEMCRLAYKKEEDFFVLIGSNQKADMAFTLGTDDTLTLVDTSWIVLNNRWESRPLHIKFQKVEAD